MNTTITWTEIEQRHKQLCGELAEIIPLDQWSLPPKGIKSTKHKTKYGMADHSGCVHINQAFMGTTARQLLDATIRHELAHLCAGLHQGHNKTFKKVAAAFGATFDDRLKTEYQQLNQAIGHKYMLFAQLVDQQEVMIKKAHRKHPKYLNYQPGKWRYLTLNGKKVVGFRYQTSAD